MIDVLVDGQFAYYATPYLDEQHILQSIHTACENAKRASKYSIYKFTQEEVRKGHEGTYRTNCSDSVMDLSISEVKDIALSGAETLLRPKEIVHAAVSIELVQRTTKIYSTSGANIDQKMDMALIELSSTAKNKLDSQTRSNHGMRGHCYQTGATFVKNYDIEQEATMVSAQAVELLLADQCPTEITD